MVPSLPYQFLFFFPLQLLFWLLFGILTPCRHSSLWPSSQVSTTSLRSTQRSWLQLASLIQVRYWPCNLFSFFFFHSFHFKGTQSKSRWSSAYDSSHGKGIDQLLTPLVISFLFFLFCWNGFRQPRLALLFLKASLFKEGSVESRSWELVKQWRQVSESAVGASGSVRFSSRGWVLSRQNLRPLNSWSWLSAFSMIQVLDSSLWWDFLLVS